MGGRWRGKPAPAAQARSPPTHPYRGCCTSTQGVSKKGAVPVPTILPMWLHVSEANLVREAYEAEHGVHYAAVVRARTDMVFQFTSPTNVWDVSRFARQPLYHYVRSSGSP